MRTAADRIGEGPCAPPSSTSLPTGWLGPLGPSLLPRGEGRSPFGKDAWEEVGRGRRKRCETERDEKNGYIALKHCNHSVHLCYQI
jgi:hypothetical protein